MQTTDSVSKSLDVLDVEVFADKYGLRLVKIGANSPFRRLVTPGDALLRGAMEIGDRIVAINGLLARHPDDLEALRVDHRMFEICIFDHRTHQTVSWELKAIDELHDGGRTGLRQSTQHLAAISAKIKIPLHGCFPGLLLSYISRVA